MRKLQIILGLKSCSIFLANKTTISVNEFDPEKVDKLMKGQKRLLQIILEGLNIGDWNVFLEDEWEQVIGPGAETTYNNMIERVGRALGLSTEESHKNYFARETAVVLTLLQHGMSDIKIGWHSKGRQNGETVFDESIVLCLKQMNIPRDIISFIYGLDGKTLDNQTKAPYIIKLGDLEHRICLRPFEDPLEKIKEHGGLLSNPPKRLFGGIVQLFEKVILEGKQISVPTFNPSFPGQKTAEKLKAMLAYIFRDPDQRREAESIWENTFQAL